MRYMKEKAAHPFPKMKKAAKLADGAISWILRRAKEAAKILLILMGVVLVWSGSYWIFLSAGGVPTTTLDSENLMTVLFGASSIALFFLSFLVALMGTLGWRSYKGFRRRVIRDIQEMRTEIEKIGNELKGRVSTVLGFALGEMCLAGSFEVKPEDRERLEDAVKQCIEGHKHLKKVGGSAEFLGLNNLIYYTCVLQGGLPAKPDEGHILRQARRLFDAGEERASPMLVLTACRAFFEYSATTEDKAGAEKALRALLTQKISDRERKEASFYLDKYCQAPERQHPQPSSDNKQEVTSKAASSRSPTARKTKNRQ